MQLWRVPETHNTVASSSNGLTLHHQNSDPPTVMNIHWYTWLVTPIIYAWQQMIFCLAFGPPIAKNQVLLMSHTDLLHATHSDPIRA